MNQLLIFIGTCYGGFAASCTVFAFVFMLYNESYKRDVAIKVGFFWPLIVIKHFIKLFIEVCKS